MKFYSWRSRFISTTIILTTMPLSKGKIFKSENFLCDGHILHLLALSDVSKL